MKISLKKLQVIQQQASEALTELERDLIQKSVFRQDLTIADWEQYLDQQQEVADIVEKIVELSGAIGNIRVEQGKMNNSAGVNQTLTQIATLQRLNQILLEGQSQAEQPVTKNQFNRKQTQINESTSPHLSNSSQFGAIPDFVMDTINTKTKANKREINELKEKLLEQNISTKLNLSDYVVGILQKHGII